jgi:hypothetical protein
MFYKGWQYLKKGENLMGQKTSGSVTLIFNGDEYSTFIIDYEYESGCPGTLEYPADPAEVNIKSIYLNNVKLSDGQMENLIDDDSWFDIVYQKICEDADERIYQEVYADYTDDELV